MTEFRNQKAEYPENRTKDKTDPSPIVHCPLSIVATFPLYYHHDKQGTVTTLTCLDACIRNSASYDAWGAPQQVYAPPIIGMRKIDIVTEFTVYTYDKVLQNYDAKARMYDPQNKRFMAQDIIAGVLENPQTLNRYPYVLNNPKTYIDPTGEFLDALRILRSDLTPRPLTT
ncbi:MAG: hypothetical protein FWF88_10685 [Peptococcaceae bacterium]|nr:hypothetical protein [Peptococcaceae bacterium]